MRYEDIENMSNAEAVAYYGPLTHGYIPCSDLENLLGWAGLAVRNPVTGAWEGSLIDFMNSNTVPALSAGLSNLFSHLNKPRSVGIDSHLQPWASSMEDLFNGLIAVGQVDAAFKADVVELAGGYDNAGVTEADVQLLRDNHDVWLAEKAASDAQQAAQLELVARQVEFSSRYNQYLSPVLGDPASTDADIKLALETLALTYGA
jgi:hypothetical protein